CVTLNCLNDTWILHCIKMMFISNFQNKTTEENQRQLSLEMQKIRDEMASNSVRWERLQREKTALEVAFERELQELQLQQETELAAVEEGLRKCHSAETEHLKAEHQSEMEELRTHQQEQVRGRHDWMKADISYVMRSAVTHEQQKMLLEEDFEKLRLSLQDALAPYQHIEQDLKSLKEVVEMKNQQIHQQEKKISDLEKVAQKNVFLEEKVQVLQQQNEDLKARIEMNLALSRQLSEDNANLQESVEKESTEKKRLSRNNEELLWRLQTSPLMSPASSPLHRSFSTSPVPSSPLFFSSPVAGCDSPTHCHGCSQQAQYSSPSHRAATNQNLSPGPATPAHRAAVNQNFSSNPATPAHRAAVNQNSSSNPATPAHRAAVNQNSSSNPATPTHRASASRCNSNSCLSSLQR
uniref:Microtubule associated scaffold protein 2 n=1 Tax=Amphiprion ocellaris TaxID=80972 RepID=A0AAQ5ZVE4_AMPOC